MGCDEFKQGAKEVLTGLVCGVLLTSFGVGLYRSAFYSSSIPKANEVQQGYVIPSELEIYLQDFDRNGQREVLMKYKGESYLFKVDKQDKPVIKPYEIKVIE